MKKNVSCYCLNGFCSCSDIDYEFPDFQFETKSLKFLIDFVSTVNDECIELEIIRFFDDGSLNQIDVYKLRELIEVLKNE